MNIHTTCTIQYVLFWFFILINRYAFTIIPPISDIQELVDVSQRGQLDGVVSDLVVERLVQSAVAARAVAAPHEQRLVDLTTTISAFAKFVEWGASGRMVAVYSTFTNKVFLVGATKRDLIVSIVKLFNDKWHWFLHLQQPQRASSSTKVHFARLKATQKRFFPVVQYIFRN